MKRSFVGILVLLVSVLFLSVAYGEVNFTSMLAKKAELKTATDTNNVQTGVVKVSKVSVGVKKQTALVHIAAGDSGVSAAPIKFTKGKLLNAAEAGAVEYDSINVYITDKNALRKTIISGSTGTKPAYVDTALVWVRVIFGVDTLKMPLYK